jgi:hypothetical protein
MTLERLGQRALFSGIAVHTTTGPQLPKVRVRRLRLPEMTLETWPPPQRLRRHLHEAPKLRKPPIGPNPYAKDDLAWIDEIRQLPSWPESGLVYWVNFRDTVLFVTQALVGGKMLEIGDGETAYKLATTKIHDR